MFIGKLKKYILIFILSIGSAVSFDIKSAKADITAVDFNGNVIGHVISTGMVINQAGENIGYITADSLIVNNNDEIIGGVIPQGVVIGNDNRLLGKVNTDGIVRSLTGKVLGRALPNGLVIDEQSRILGAILFPGLIYSSKGETIGRVTGVGTYANLDGVEIGFVSSNGFAYKKSGDDYSLDGRLMSSKMVVSLDGKFIGSIAPSGTVIDIEGREIGSVHANEYVYSGKGEIIGHTVKPGYAFDTKGRYLGIISYNGEILGLEEKQLRYRADGNIVNDKNEVIGFSVEMSATASDNNGDYLGYVVPNGVVIKDNQVVGLVGANKVVINQEGERIGQLIESGPVFDVFGNLIGQSSRDGSFVSLGGNVIGKMKGKYAFDTNGTLMGGLSQNMLSININNKFIGISDIKSMTENKDIVSPFGYLFNSDKKIIGSNLPLKAIYGIEGIPYSYVNPNGKIYRNVSDVILDMNGILLGRDGFIGSYVSSRYIVDFSGKNLGIATNNNLILTPKKEMAYKIIPGNYIVRNPNGIPDRNLMPIVGFSGDNIVAINTSGDLLGYTDVNGNVLDRNGNIKGSIVYGDYIVDVNNSPIGKVLPFTTVMNEKCSTVGILNGKGEVVNNRDVVLGRMLGNGQAVSDVGSYIGYGVFNKGLIDFDGNYVGSVHLGQGVDYDNNVLGCVNRQGIITDEDNIWKYSTIYLEPVIDYNNQIIGQVLANGSVVDGNNDVIGYMQPNEDVVSKSRKILGLVMRYKIAFNNDNEFFGMISNSGEVIGEKGDVVGRINYDGSVSSGDTIIGYGLYDWYVYDDEFITNGYITKDGAVLNLNGSKIGKLDKGFVIDKNNKVIARGNRDYTIRDVSNNALGELQFDGNVTNYDNKNIGYLSEGGSIRDSNGDEIAKAYPLQYYTYSVKKEIVDTKQDWSDYKRVEIQDETKKDTSNVKVSKPTNLSKKIVGIALSPDGDILGNIYDDNSVYDDNGNQIGLRTPDGIIVDMNYNPIGVEDVKSAGANNMFMPAGTFGGGNAYGIGDKPSNLGPGGGYGAGERYDPYKASQLADMHNARRSGMNWGTIESKVKISNFTGYEEDDWPGSNRAISTWRVDMSEMILQDKPIPAVLARSVYASDGLGSNIPVTAIVERNVYAEEGRNIIIPAGSRVIGALDGTGENGSSGGAVKIGITWIRLIRPDGSQFTLGSSQTADAQGRAGAIGYLDEQLLKRYTKPLLTTALQSASLYIMADGKSSENADGETTSDARSEAASDARETFMEQMNQIFEDIMETKTDIKAVTYIPAGTRIIIFPNQDLWLNSEKRSQAAEDNQERSNDKGLTESKPTGSRDSMGGGYSSGPVNNYNEYEEDIQPASSLLDEDPTGSVSRRKKLQQVPPSTTQQVPSSVSTDSAEDSVPSLL